MLVVLVVDVIDDVEDVVLVVNVVPGRKIECLLKRISSHKF